jgi:hypothetical protein
VEETGPYFVNEPLTWNVTIANLNDTTITNITVLEDITKLTGLNTGTLVVTPSTGTWDLATLTWSVPSLAGNTTASLELKTSFDTVGDKTNNASITAVEPADSSIGKQASDTITVGVRPVGINVRIEPVTLNLRSNGVFTVFITFSEGVVLDNVVVGSITPSR